MHIYLQEYVANVRIVGLKMREILSQLPEQDIKIFCNVNHLYLCQKLREEKKATLCKAVFSGN